LELNAGVVGGSASLALLDQVNRHAGEFVQLGGGRGTFAGAEKAKACQPEMCLDHTRQGSRELAVLARWSGGCRRACRRGCPRSSGSSSGGVRGFNEPQLSEGPEILSRDADQVGEERLLGFHAVQNHQDVLGGRP